MIVFSCCIGKGSEFCFKKKHDYQSQFFFVTFLVWERFWRFGDWERSWKVCWSTVARMHLSLLPEQHAGSGGCTVLGIRERYRENERNQKSKSQTWLCKQIWNDGSCEIRSKFDETFRGLPTSWFDLGCGGGSGVNVGIFMFLTNDISTADSQAPVIRIVVAGWDGSKSDSEARKVMELCYYAVTMPRCFCHLVTLWNR